jgi:hypothetical protein
VAFPELQSLITGNAATALRNVARRLFSSGTEPACPGEAGLELLRIDKDTPLEIETDGKALIIRPAHEPAGRPG